MVFGPVDSKRLRAGNGELLGRVRHHWDSMASEVNREVGSEPRNRGDISGYLEGAARRRISQTGSASSATGSQIQRISLWRTARPRSVKNRPRPIGETRMGVQGRK